MLLNFITIKKSFFGLELEFGRQTAEVVLMREGFIMIYTVKHRKSKRWYSYTVRGVRQAMQDWLHELYEATREEAA